MPGTPTTHQPYNNNVISYNIQPITNQFKKKEKKKITNKQPREKRKHIAAISSLYTKLNYNRICYKNKNQEYPQI